MAYHDSREDRQRAIALTALAYHLNGASQQYDSVALTYLDPSEGGNKRQNQYISPEEATSQHTVYTVCSSFGFEVYYEALGYELMGAFGNNTTAQQIRLAPPETVVFRYDADNDPLPQNEAAERLKSLLQQGDAIVITKRNGHGHFMIYAGDVDGDGIPKVIHSTIYGGGKYNMETGEDLIEEHGDIRKDPAEKLLFTENADPGYYLAGQDMRFFMLLRPLDGEAGRMPLTANARARLKYPALRIDRTCSAGYYGSVGSGEKLTYTVELTNFSSEDRKGIPVVETLPEGTELFFARRAKKAGRTLLWNLDLKAGEKKKVSYTVRVKAARGTLITSGGGFAGGVHSNILHTVVRGAAVRPFDLQGKLSYRKIEAEAPVGTAFAEALYRIILGQEILLPKAEDLFKSLFTPIAGAPVPAYRFEAKNDRAAALLIRDYFGGRSIVTQSPNERVLELRKKDLSAGDVLIFSKGAVSEESVGVWVCTGRELLALENGRIVTVPEKEMVKLLQKDFFIGLRPSQVYDFEKKRKI